jgi:hypothetical protein
MESELALCLFLAIAELEEEEEEEDDDDDDDDDARERERERREAHVSRTFLERESSYGAPNPRPGSNPRFAKLEENSRNGEHSLLFYIY